MIVLVILVTVSGIIMTIMFRMAMAQGSIANRTEMHASVRSATEVMQQEIGQAGRVALPPALSSPYTLNGAGSTCTGLTGNNYVVCGVASASALAISSTVGMFPGEILIVGPDATVTSASQEALTITAMTGTTITGIFQDPHASGAAVTVRGTFPAGVIPPSGNKELSW